jgi:hypothetical protein
MIVVNIKGGLGNQMFQYAAAKRLALNNGHKLFVDITFLKYYPIHFTNTRRDFELDHFNISANIKEQDNRLILYLLRNKYINKLISLLIKIFKNYNTVDERNYFVDLKKDGNYILEGYFQSELYFKHIETTIRQEFSLKGELDHKNKILAQRMEIENSISLHVRRGDYTNPNNSSVYHICPKEYFEEAIKYISRRVERTSFFIFSDDMEWVKANLALNFPVTYVEHNTINQSYLDLVLMSKCKHNIISNSTFSWWGAWLNKNNNKIVIAPDKWTIQNDVSNIIIPDNWIKLKS